MQKVIFVEEKIQKRYVHKIYEGWVKGIPHKLNLKREEFQSESELIILFSTNNIGGKASILKNPFSV